MRKEFIIGDILVFLGNTKSLKRYSKVVVVGQHSISDYFISVSPENDSTIVYTPMIEHLELYSTFRNDKISKVLES